MAGITDTISELEAINLQSETALEDVKHLIQSKLKKLPTFLSDFKETEYVVRARILEDKEDYHQAISDYSYNPNPKYIKLGRANYAGQPIFYAARYRITALSEVRFIYSNREKDLTRYSLSRWEPNTTLKLATIVSAENIRKHKATELYGLAEHLENFSIENKDNKEIQDYLEIYQYMADKFREPIKEGEEFKYLITSVFSNLIYDKLPDADGILYQSVQYPANFNIALKASVIDSNKMKLTLASRQTYARTGVDSFKETEQKNAKGIDHDKKTIIWG